MAFERRGAPLVAALVSLVIFVAVGEAVIRVYVRTHILYDMEMARYAKALKIPASNPAMGHVHRPNSSARLMGVDVRVNSDGLRDREYPVARNERYRIIFLGDSLTLGWGVRQEETFAKLMEETLNERTPVEILNLGIGNYNTEQEVHLFIDKGLKYRPDKLVLFYFINDAEPTPWQSRWSLLEYSELVSFYWSRVRGVGRNLLLSDDYRAYYARLYGSQAPGWEAAKRSLLVLKQVCERHRIALQVVLLPELHELENYPFKREHAAVSAFLTAQGIAHLDLAPSFGNERQPSRLWVAPDDAHPNALAHRLIAQRALEFVAPKRSTARNAQEILAKE